MLHVLHARDRARFQRSAIHDRGIELGEAIMGQHRATPGIELRIVFEHANGGRHRIEARAATLEHGIARIPRRFEPGAIVRLPIGGHIRFVDDPCAAVDHDRNGRLIRGIRRVHSEPENDECGGGNGQARGRQRTPDGIAADAGIPCGSHGSPRR
jgi:hypothetical protein